MIKRIPKISPLAKLITFVLVIVAVSTILAYFQFSLKGGQESARAEKITIGIARNIISCLSYIAEEKGFYRNYGLDASLREYPAGLIALEEMLKGRVDVSTCADIVFVIRGSSEESLRIFTTIARAEDHRIVIRGDLGIVKPEDLKGKRIGVTRNTSSHFFLETFLSFNEIPLGNVHIIDVPPSEMVSAVASGRVDSVCTWEPHVSKILAQLGPTVLNWPVQNGRNYNWVLIANDNFLNTRKSAIQKLLKAMLAAEQFVARNPGEAQAILSKRMDIDPVRLHAIWDRFDFRVRIDQDLLILMEDEARWAMRRGLVSMRSMPDYMLSIDFGDLEKMKPDAIGVIH